MSTKSAGEPRSSILSLVKQVQYRAYVRLESVLHPFGITAVQFRILRTLSLSPGITSADLARLYGVKPQTMAKQITLLDAQGLISREISQAHRRLLELRLSAEGEAVFAKVQQDALALEKALLEPLTAKERLALTTLLERLATAWAPDGARHEDAVEFSGEYGRAGVQRG